MTLNDITSAISATAYRAACDAARRAAGDPHYGSQDAAEQFDSEIPHDMAWHIWDSSEAELDKLDLAIHAKVEVGQMVDF